ncbi:autotransporter assembly complex protein TamA [Yoonia litorea]|uniref:Autotransporter secretion outer membrane protein TamA n=1 Tax=Yoonia litorea TaxID=1123755 RepID=A0A1I6MXD7_9RHOB|nr:BamA/TamA family outer membrane protein [Yoonia litorea]SFS20329.1 autotransporter secretion outer membrane protein TamA [Yoonia litorea]
MNLVRWAAIALTGTVTSLGTGVVAQDVTLETDRAREALQSASLLLSLDDEAAPQDYVAAARADYRRLLTALYAEGFYGGAVSITLDGTEAANVAPLAAPGSIENVVITVDAGPRFRFGDVAISPLPQGTTLDADLGPRQPARSGEIQEAVSGAIATWRDLGYAKVSVADQSIVARHPENLLNVAVTLDTGPRLRFGELTVTGNRVVSDARIRQIAGLPTGEVFSPDELAAAERRLRRTGTFESVSFTEADQIADGDRLPITALISEAKPRRIGFGIELSSIEGLTLSSYWLHRNFLGGAERFRAEAEVSGIAGETGGIDYSLGANFNRPAVFGPDTDYFLEAQISREDEPEFLIDKIAIETGFSRIISEDLTVRAGVGVLRAREERESETREYTLFTLPLDATLDRRDAPSNARNGYFIDVSATPFISADGDIAGARSFADLRGYVTVGEEERLTFAGRGQVGSILGASVDEAPADFLFYSGGGGTVRGQPYKSLGLETTEGGDEVTTGGTSFIGAQLEARYLFGENLAVVGFYDIGHVGPTATPAEDGEWHAGTGLGVRYNTGIGPIRLDIGTPASGDDAFGAVQVYIGIGQAF